MYTALSLRALSAVARHPGSYASPSREWTQLMQGHKIFQNSRPHSRCLRYFHCLQMHNRAHIVVDNLLDNKQLYGFTRYHK